MTSVRRSEDSSVDYSLGDFGDLDLTDDDFDDGVCEEGDLGLGRGAKPGGLRDDLAAVTECNVIHVQFDPDDVTSPSDTTSGYCSSRTDSANSQRSKGKRFRFKNLRRSLKDCARTSKEDNEHNSTINSSVSSLCPDIPGVIQLPCQTADQVQILRSEIEVYKSLLASKCDAIKLLRALLVQVNEVKDKREEELNNECESLKSKVNDLQFMVDCQESKFQDGQDYWLDKLNTLSEKNGWLERNLATNEEIVKRVNNEKAALTREKMELLALLDTKERRKYERSNSFTSDNCYGPISSGELAVLGACVCRGSKMEPCRCAEAACAKQKEIQHLHNQMDKNSNKMRELRDTCDIYKKAFNDEQRRCSYLIKRNASIEAILEKSHPRKLKRLEDCEVVDTFTEMLCEKNEALVHQQMVTKFLAKKVSELEISLEKERKCDI